MSSVATLRVLVNETAVGDLILNSTDGCEFRLLESYKQSYPRLVLGQIFLDDLNKVHYSRSRLPAWFSNLLPEGPLREMIARQAKVASSREYFLLHHLGNDLPGAVRVIAEGPLPIPVDQQAVSNAVEEENTKKMLHFSLAGVQLKFSAQRLQRGLTIPASGQGGDWIIKLPDARYPDVPINEYSTMLWARASGLRIPEIALVSIADISGLPESVTNFNEKQSFAIKRFDRPVSGQRIHMEDFAQILNIYPEEKYDKYNYETLARLILSLAGRPAFDEFVQRLVFIIMSGNGDAHHKNWSLLYPDGIHAELSPAYDLVSTIQYLSKDSLALNLAKSKAWENIKMESFRRMARKLEIDEEAVVAGVEASIAAVLDAWRASATEFGFGSDARRIVEQHWQSIPLLKHG